MNLFEKFQLGLSYQDFLAQYATEEQMKRWWQVHEQIKLTEAQRQLLSSFRRDMNVLCLAGAWCGDCINQCPAFDHFAAAAPPHPPGALGHSPGGRGGRARGPVIHLRFLDRDDHADLQRELQINGGNRVPVLVFFSEDGFEVARYGERTLSKYRQMIRDQAGPSCPTGLVIPGDSLLSQVTQDWLSEFERVQWLLRLSLRLRQMHGD